MDVVDIIKDALRYPVNNYKTWTLMAVLFFVIGILETATTYKIGTAGYIILSIIIFVVGLLVMGYALKLLKGLILGSYSDEMIRPEEDFIGGIKSFIVLFVYEIIPSIIVAILIAIAGLSDQFTNIVSISANNASAISAVPNEVMVTFATSIVIISIIAFILYVIFYLFSVIGMGRLAETDSIGAALNFSEVSSRISSIGWGRYIVFIVATLIVFFVLGIISGLIGYIPVVGGIITCTIVDSFGILFFVSAIAGIYNDYS